MIQTLVLAAALAAAPEPAPAPDAAVAPASLRLRLQEEDWEDETRYPEEPRRAHVHLSVWGGEAFANAGAGSGYGFASAEAAWLFSSLDLGLALSGYRFFRESTREWTPVVLTRFTQRFASRRGFEAAFTLGFGAGRPSGWVGWYQVAIGIRLPLGPLFLGGELAFEQYDLLRLAGGLGVAF